MFGIDAVNLDGVHVLTTRLYAEETSFVDYSSYERVDPFFARGRIEHWFHSPQARRSDLRSSSNGSRAGASRAGRPTTTSSRRSWAPSARTASAA